MSQLSHMTRYVSSWLGWLPVATATFDSCLSSSSPSSGNNQAEDATAMLQESSGIFTVVALYLAMTIVLATVSFCTAKDKATKDSNRSRNKRKLATQKQQKQQQEQEQKLPWRYSAMGMTLTKLIRQLATPKRSRHQMRLRLQMRLRRHLEQELKLIRELEEKGPQLGLLGDQDQDAEEANNNSTYFDPSSEADP